MILCTGEFPILVGGEATGDRPRRPATNRSNVRVSEKPQAGQATSGATGMTDRGRPPPVIGMRLVVAMWWVAFGSAALQLACG